MSDAVEGLSAGAALLLDRLTAGLRGVDQITLVLGSGVSAAVIPRVQGVLEIADSFAAGRNDDGALERALEQARAELVGARPIDVYRAYRRVFTDWVSAGAFDVIAQQAVLKAYAAADPMESPLATHGLGQRHGGDPVGHGDVVEDRVAAGGLGRRGREGVEVEAAEVGELPPRHGGVGERELRTRSGGALPARRQPAGIGGGRTSQSTLPFGVR